MFGNGIVTFFLEAVNYISIYLANVIVLTKWF